MNSQKRKVDKIAIKRNKPCEYARSKAFSLELIVIISLFIGLPLTFNSGAKPLGRMGRWKSCKRK